eukprot:758274-Hanusia_phi.AAC.2
MVSKLRLTNPCLHVNTWCDNGRRRPLVLCGTRAVCLLLRSGEKKDMTGEESVGEEKIGEERSGDRAEER